LTGTGKTLTTIAVLGAMYISGKIKRVIIVAPLSIVGVWQEELQKFADFDYAAVILEGSSVKKTDTLRHMTGSALQVVIVNYESAWRLEGELLKFNADIVVADEGHKIKTHNTKQSKALHNLGAKAKYRMLLTLMFSASISLLIRQYSARAFMSSEAGILTWWAMAIIPRFSKNQWNRI
jgi:SNF2 family DNA or RNA helicase